MNTAYQPGDFNCGCKMGEQVDGCRSPGNCSSGACEPCPETPGSDCSRCDNPPKDGTSFPPPSSEAVMRLRPAVYDQVRVPKLPPGKYVVGFRYDCDATAQVWSNCGARCIIVLSRFDAKSKYVRLRSGHRDCCITSCLAELSHPQQWPVGAHTPADLTGNWPLRVQLLHVPVVTARLASYSAL